MSEFIRFNAVLFGAADGDTEDPIPILVDDDGVVLVVGERSE